MNLFANAALSSPSVGAFWQNLTESARLEAMSLAIRRLNPEMLGLLKFVTAKDDGQVIVRLEKAMKAAERGTVLLDLEMLLKSNIDEGVVVWLEPLGDKSSLRKLRGIEVKA